MSKENRDFVLNVIVPLILADDKLTSEDNIIYKYLDSCELNEISLDEAYMLTNCFRLKLFLFSDKEKTDRREFNLFVKTTPNIQAEQYDAIGFDEMFANEQVGYTDVLPAIEQMSSRNVHTPKLIGCYNTSDSQSVVTTDFTVDGWRLSESRVNLSLEHILVAVELLGTFHGNAYALKHKNPEYFHKVVGKLRECRYKNDTMDKTWLSSWHSGIRRSAKAAKGLVPDSFLDQLITALADPYGLSKKLCEPVEPIAILCHGDFLRNNMAFQYKDDIPIAAMMFDMQTLRYSSPMIDMSQFMANSTGKDVRPMHFQTIFKTYHSALTNSYQSNQNTTLELPEFLSYNNLLREYATHLISGFVVATFFLMDLHCPEKVSFFDQSEEGLVLKTSTSGGKVVDDELAALVKDLYDLSVQFNLDITKLV